MDLTYEAPLWRFEVVPLWMPLNYELITFD